MLIVVGVVVIAFGAVSFLKRDWIWELTRMGNDWRGVASERTELWETRTVIGGIVAIVFGGILIWLGVTR